MKFPYRSTILLSAVFIFCVFWNLLLAKYSQNQQSPLKRADNYNIVLIFIDTLRADHLGCYGYSRKTSPNIDKLSKEAFVFEQNFATASYTLASFMSIITSLYPKSHGVLEVYKDRLSPRAKTLAQVLQSYGYETAWFGPKKSIHLNLDVGFGWGFNTTDIFIPRLDESRKLISDWLVRNKDKKFFLNFHTSNIHDPYMPSLKYKQRFAKNESVRGIVEDERWLMALCRQFVSQEKEKVREIMGAELFEEFVATGSMGGSHKAVKDFFHSRNKAEVLHKIRDFVYWSSVNLEDPLVNAHMQALYDAEILEFDEEIIGPLVRQLKALNIYNKTIIIICADHGDEFYEHKGHGHGGTLFDELIHVPLIIRVPQVKQGRRIKELTQTVDIMPTLLDLVGIPVPHQAQGKSLIPLINNRGPFPIHDYVFGQILEISYIRSKEWKLLLKENGIRKLYRVAQDPQEQKNVYSENQDIALRLESTLRQLEAALPSYREEEYSYPPEIDEAAKERIRKTGYW